ncbi:DUF645 family protein [Vibrio cholerae]|nr:DUF645 family protein [Vibrio cholerae]
MLTVTTILPEGGLLALDVCLCDAFA